jgi:NAD(P)-dependent dehydrogenase (short-subunit alcohol dehydrogenase family)
MNRVALVTGAAGGIGSATVRAFAGSGWQVFAVDRQAFVEVPDGVVSLAADVSQEREVGIVVDRLTQAFGRLDAVVNNAAIQIYKPLSSISVEEWDATLASNLRSAFLTARAGHAMLRASGGAIVNVGSVHAAATSKNVAAYAASKGGLAALTRAMAVELGGDGIRVNAVLPGAVDAPMLHNGLARAGDAAAQEVALRQLEARTPLGRIGRPGEIADAILFLADSEVSSFITGQCLVVDGGALARLSSE